MTIIQLKRFLIKVTVVPAIILVVLFMVQCQKGKIFIDPQLTVKWKSEDLSVPESVKYDSVSKQLYVSNINGDPFEKDGNGYISILSMDGKTISKKWITGLDAPKGMGLYGNKLYVSNIDEFVEIDRQTATILKRYKADSAEFLNDITIDLNGVVYGSDTKRSCIYRLVNGQVSVWLSGSEFTDVNGLCYANGAIYIGTGNSILKSDTSGTKTEVITNKSGPVDGLELYENNGFIFSDYSGAVYILNKNGEIRKILDTGKAGLNAADIDFIPSRNLLLVPTFAGGHVSAYEFE